jgi:hypothetical protein
MDRLARAVARGGVLGLVLAGGPATVAAQEEFPCRPRVVSCNYAEHYSGTIQRHSELRVEGDRKAGGMVSLITEDLTVEIQDGQAVCRGSVHEREESWVNGRIEGRRRRGGTIAGAGLVAIELGIGTEDQPGEPYVRISLACPTAAGSDTTEDLLNGAPMEVNDFTSEPPAMDSNGWVTEKQPTDAGYRVLKGRTSEDAPETDPVNGVTGTVTFEWSLTRRAQPARRPGPTGRQVR